LRLKGSHAGAEGELGFATRIDIGRRDDVGILEGRGVLRAAGARGGNRGVNGRHQRVGINHASQVHVYRNFVDPAEARPIYEELGVTGRRFRTRVGRVGKDGADAGGRTVAKVLS